MGPLLGRVMRIALVSEEGGHRGIDPEDDIPAFAPIAPVWLALGLAFPSNEGSDPGPSVTGPQGDPDPVDEHLFGEDVYETPVGPGPVLDGAGTQREQRVIAPPADIVSWVDARSALANEDGACTDSLAVENLRPQTLGVGLATVLGRAACFGL
jgi:hypothetical protein